MDILTLGMQADEARRAQPEGGVVTYLRVHQVSPADLAGAAQVPHAATEVRLYETPVTLDEAISQVFALRSLAGPRRVVAFSLADVEERARGGWGSMPDVLHQFIAAGLTDFAEIPVDRLTELARSVHLVTVAGIQPTRLTVSHPLAAGINEVLETVRECLERQQTVIRFAPLPRVAPIDKPTTGYEDVRTVALARLGLATPKTSGRVSIEVDWSLYGPKLAQVALMFGADHLDAVAATSDPALGPRRATVEDVERNIRAAGFEPREYRPVS